MKHTTISSMKFSTLRHRLGRPPLYQVVGLLEMLWQITTTSAQDGAIGRFTNEQIAIQMEWMGDPDELVEHLVQSGWLDRDPVHRLLVHGWEEHAPNFLKQNFKSRKKEFAKPTESDPALAPCFSTPLKHPAKAPCKSGEHTKPNLTKPNQTKPLDAYASCPELKKSSRPETVDQSPEVCTFPTNGQTKSWTLRESQVDEWRSAYPGLDVEAEVRKALGWVQSNPDRRKTAKGMPRFLFSWLGRANDRCKPVPINGYHRKPTAMEVANESAERLLNGKSAIANQIFAELQAIQSEAV